jgi:GxxExxY protein
VSGDKRSQLIHRELTRRIIGVFYEVYSELGYGFLESVYESALGMALSVAGLQVERQVPLKVRFRDCVVGSFRVDLLVERAVIVALKAVRTLESAHEAQLLNLLRASNIEVGLLLNFGPKPRVKRLVFSNWNKQNRVHPRSSAAKNS